MKKKRRIENIKERVRLKYWTIGKKIKNNYWMKNKWRKEFKVNLIGDNGKNLGKKKKKTD